MLDRPSNFLHKALQAFGAQFESKYGTKVNEILDSSYYAAAETTVHKEFSLKYNMAE